MYFNFILYLAFLFFDMTSRCHVHIILEVKRRMCGFQLTFLCMYMKRIFESLIAFKPEESYVHNHHTNTNITLLSYHNNNKKKGSKKVLS